MRRVIVIDDDRIFAGMVRQRLVQDGYQVEYNEGAFGALTAIRRGGFDVILVDVQMPDIGGPKLVEYLRERGVGRARIVFMSSIPEQELRLTAVKHGASGYFCKGWGLERLASVIEAVN